MENFDGHRICKASLSLFKRPCSVHGSNVSHIKLLRVTGSAGSSKCISWCFTLNQIASRDLSVTLISTLLIAFVEQRYYTGGKQRSEASRWSKLSTMKKGLQPKLLLDVELALFLRVPKLYLMGSDHLIVGRLVLFELHFCDEQQLRQWSRWRRVVGQFVIRFHSSIELWNG